MEPVALAEAEQLVERTLDANSDSAAAVPAPSSPKHIANPVVYQLVRVDGNGRLVPATDDEVMEVEDMVDEDKCQISSVADTGLIEGSISNEELSHGSSDLKDSEGRTQSENSKVNSQKFNARIEYIGVMLEKVKKEERLRLSVGERRHKGENSSQKAVPQLSPPVNDSSTNQSEASGKCLTISDREAIAKSSSSVTYISSKPDFSKIKGEICLDNLSIKELHETFRATFGRETTVKDKLWLKRRIAMGLTNSCDVPTTSFIIRNNTIVTTVSEEEEEKCGMQQSEDVIKVDEKINSSCEDSPIISLNNQHVHVSLSGKREREPEEHELKNEIPHTEINEQTAAKRVRKPTRRYIEELSETDTRESNGRSVFAVKTGEHCQSLRPHDQPFQNTGLDVMTVVTREESFGGSGVQVPFVSRVRGGRRPRKNFVSFLNCHPSGSMAAELITNALGVCISQQESENVESDVKDTLPSEQHEQLVNSEAEEMLNSCSGQQQSVELKNLGSCGNDSDDMTTEPAAKGVERRKHHRAWTLSEVTKLVEGVSRYGAGKWSEIKRVAFAPSSYRTSVDLKDKWRNLLRASFALTLADKAILFSEHWCRRRT
ncbi:hypothetical protein Sjap_019714 [Stephania japonica]|uniref:Uncharacterized protein n=1 Tax=Stephania japonica TaxID=461633 RepID=A0AAP0EZB0_9MAGN